MALDLVKLGSCRKAHGIKGGFSVHWDFPGQHQLAAGTEIYLHPDLQHPVGPIEEARWFKIGSIAFGNKVILYVEGINDRSAAEQLLPFTLWVRKADLPPLPADTYFVEDLEKCTVYDEQGQKVAQVVASYQTKTQVVLCLQLADGRVQDVPFLPIYFPEINIAEYKLVVRLPTEIKP